MGMNDRIRPVPKWFTNIYDYCGSQRKMASFIGISQTNICQILSGNRYLMPATILWIEAHLQMHQKSIKDFNY